MPLSQELANPYVVKHLEFYPHDPLGRDISALYQSQKWREELAREFRPQMVVSNGKHFYIYEPVGLIGVDKQVVIPIFFYQKNGRLFSKCIKPKYGAKVSSFNTYESRQFNIYIPGSLNYQDQILFEVPISDFSLIYSEIQTYHGDSFVEMAGYEISGKIYPLIV